MRKELRKEDDGHALPCLLAVLLAVLAACGRSGERPAARRTGAQASKTDAGKKSGTASPAATPKGFRVGMSWLMKEQGAFVTYVRYEIVKVANGKVTWHKTVLNAKKQPFAGDKGTDMTFPMLKVSDLAPGKVEVIKAAGRGFKMQAHRLSWRYNVALS